MYVITVKVSAAMDNRSLVDDGSSQALTDMDISELKEHGVAGKVRSACSTTYNFEYNQPISLISMSNRFLSVGNENVHGTTYMMFYLEMLL